MSQVVAPRWLKIRDVTVFFYFLQARNVQYA